MADVIHAGSFLDELKADYEHAGNREPLDLDIPWARGRLVARYGVPSREKVSAITSALAMEQKVNPDVEDDLLIDACQEILGRENGELVPLDPDKPVRFDDDRLGELLGFTASSARECLHRTFRVDEYPLAITGHFGALLEYLQTVEAGQQARVEGKSAPAPGRS